MGHCCDHSDQAFTGASRAFRRALVIVIAINALMFLVETAFFVYPLVVLSTERRTNSKKLLYAALSMLIAGSLYRFNAFLITFDPGPGYSYFPSFPEIMVTLGLVAIEIMIFLYIVKRFPVLHRDERKHN